MELSDISLSAAVPAEGVPQPVAASAPAPSEAAKLAASVPVSEGDIKLEMGDETKQPTAAAPHEREPDSPPSPRREGQAGEEVDEFGHTPMDLGSPLVAPARRDTVDPSSPLKAQHMERASSQKHVRFPAITELTGWEAVKAHPFFKGVDWALMATRTLRPPYVPNLKDNQVHCNNRHSLAEHFLTEDEKHAPLSAEQQKQFEGFEYNTDVRAIAAAKQGKLADGPAPAHAAAQTNGVAKPAASDSAAPAEAAKAAQ